MKEKIKKNLTILGIILLLLVIGIIWWNQHQENAKWIEVCKTKCIYDKEEKVWVYSPVGYIPTIQQLRRDFPVLKQCIDFCLPLEKSYSKLRP